MELQAIYFETRPEQIAYIKFIFESYEEVGIIRTVDRKKAVVADFADVARKIIESLEREVPLFEIGRPADIKDDWFMAELAGKS